MKEKEMSLRRQKGPSMAIQCVLLVVVIALCAGCRATAPVNDGGSALATNDAPAPRAGVPSAAETPVVVVYYFHRTFRCFSCLSLETAALDVLKERFAQQMQDERVVWVPVNIEDPQTETLRQQLEVRSNGLVLVRIENGAYKDAKRMDELWGLKDRPQAFAECLIREVDVRLRAARGN